MNDHLGIGVIGLPGVTTDCLKFNSDLSVVVDLAIEGDPNAAILVAHGLAGRSGQIDDRESTMPQTDTAVLCDPRFTAIGSTMDHRVAHFGYVRRSDLEARIGEDKRTYYPAHG
jgi:hypothetical protein